MQELRTAAKKTDLWVSMRENSQTEFLTTRELADLLRIKERKVYELASSGQIPVTRATGKLLFARSAINAWMESSSSGHFPIRHGPAHSEQRPLVFAGSHDPLLEWSLRESRSGLATYFDGSLDGLARFKSHQALAFALHIRDERTGLWNSPLVEQTFTDQPVVLVEFAWRERGLLIRAADRHRIRHLRDLVGRRIVPRQAEAGTQLLLHQLLDKEGIAATEVDSCEAARTETDAALAVSEGKADTTFGLAGLARQLQLHFVPIITERFDFLVEHRCWFEPEMQRFAAFCGGRAFRQKAAELGGYNVDGFGTVHFNSWPGRIHKPQSETFSGDLD